MKTKIYIILIGLTFSLAPSMLNGATDINYFPLAIGNTWNYKYWDIVEKGLPTSQTVSDSIRLGDKLYFKLSYSDKYMNYSLFLRSDSAGRIWRNDAGIDKIWFDFSLPDSSKYKYADAGNTFNVLVIENLTANAIIGDFKNCKVFYFDIPDVFDSGAAYYFAPMVGLVQIRCGDGSRELLTGYCFPADSIKVSVKNEFESTSNLRSIISLDNFPNPFNSSTTINYQLSSASNVQMAVYNIHGQLIKTLVDEYKHEGYHSIIYDAQNMASGIYFIQMIVPDQSEVKQILYVR